MSRTTYDLREAPFSTEHLDMLGLWPGGVYETLVRDDRPAGPVRPMGIHVHDDGSLHMDAYLPSSFESLAKGDRLRLGLPAYRDIGLLVWHVLGREVHGIEGLPGLVAEVAGSTRMTVRNGYGEAILVRFLLRPLVTALPPAPWSPVCRAHGHLVEAAVLLTKPSHEGAAGHLEEARRTASASLRELADFMEKVI